MTITFVPQYELTLGAVITTARYNALVRDLNALATRVSGQVTRGSATMGTTMGVWADFFTSSISLSPKVSVKAMTFFTVALYADVKDQWVDNQFQFILNGVRDAGKPGKLWIQHGAVSGSAHVTLTSLTMTLPLTLVDGVNSLNVQYSTANNAGANFKIAAARLIAWEI